MGTTCGVILTFIALTLVVIYAVNKVITLQTDEGRIWSNYDVEAYLDPLEAKFSREQGLNLAFAFADHPNYNDSEN